MKKNANGEIETVKVKGRIVDMEDNMPISNSIVTLTYFADVI